MSTTIHPQTPSARAIHEAAARLRPGTPRRWGTMDASAMLEHLTRFHEIYLGRRRAPWLVRVLARLLGRPFVRKFLATSPFEMPREMRTLPGLAVDAVETSDADFDALREGMLRTFDEIESKTGRWRHPLYGTIDAEVGRALTRHHAAHHLGQFGVLQPTSEDESAPVE